MLSPIDQLTVIAYLAGVGGIRLYVARRQRTTEAYFLANRRVPGWAVSFSILGTIISSVSFVALPGAAFHEGWWLIVPNLMVPVVLIVAMKYVVPLYRQVLHMSCYEYLERRFGILARTYGAVGFTLLRTVDLGFTLLLTAIAVEVMTGWNVTTVILTIGCFTTFYTLVGGMEAVVWTDVLQGVVLVGGALLVLYLEFDLLKVPVFQVVATAADAGRFDLGDFDFHWSSLFSAKPPIWMLALSGLAHFGRMYITEQNMVQRYLIARSDAEAKRGLLHGAVGALGVWLLFMFISSCLWAFYLLSGEALPATVAAKPDNVLPYFIATYFPLGLVGLVLAALMAAAMSTVSADLNSVATVATQDLYSRIFPRASDRSRLVLGRVAVAIGGTMAVFVALLLTQARAMALYEAVVYLGMIFAGGILGLFALGLLTKRANRQGAYVGMFVCIAFVIWATPTGPLGVDLGFNFSMNTLMIGIISHPLLFVTGYLASMLIKENKASRKE